MNLSFLLMIALGASVNLSWCTSNRCYVSEVQEPSVKVTKVIIPAAGLGTRFLPFTKSIPKEMIPVYIKPSIHYCLEEVVSSGLTHCSIIVSKDKNAIGDYFDSNATLEQRLAKDNKSHLLTGINEIRKQVRFSYIRQAEQMGLGHAILQANHVIGNEYFAVSLPDNIMISDQPVLGQLMSLCTKHKASVIAVEEVPLDQVSAYGVIAIKRQIAPGLYEIARLVEKPKPEDAPSNLIISGRYVLSPVVFDSLTTLLNEQKFTKGELQLTDALEHMLEHGHTILAYKVDALRYDTGIPLGWLQAVICEALKDPSCKDGLKNFLSEIQSDPEKYRVPRN